ncbi:multicopper oxidase family protein [Rhizobium alvei]|uniref:Multicopper oxidase domain-containing protein n=1 Tax=Rhizobium alvei TaxID=1132659 RepID=A0ABT8YM38_9HYPH|nr:multicopper oxidase domain-containing protein [Rhizobium alvei]MDO6964312.1 multicopper oxidase domain-containing protein [Rhizobium alvei]
MNRREFLAAATGLAASTFIASPFGKAYAAPQRQKLTISTRTLDVNGRAATVYGLTGADGKPGLTIEPGADFAVDLVNGLKEETIIHWHGLLPPVEQDGVPDNPLPMLKGAETRAYDFPIHAPGTYWMHAHTLQEQNLLAAPLIVHSQDDRTADRQEIVVLLHDFSFTPAEELLAKLTGGNGGMHHGMNHGAMDMGTMDMGAMSESMGNMHGNMQDMGAMGSMAMDLNDIDYDAYLANDRTLDDPEVHQVEKGGRVLLRFINGASSTAFSIDTGALSAKLVAVDGKPVAPVAGNLFPMTMGQRIDLALDVPSSGGAFPILALREGAAQRTGIVLATAGAMIGRLSALADQKGPVLDLALEQTLSATNPLAQRTPDVKAMVHLTGDMMSYRWQMMGIEDLALKGGERVEFSMMNMSMMAHPMHLHGHDFQVVAINGRRFSGALRDTVLVPPMQTLTIAFDAGKPGHWPFHCHHLYHMVSGMMVHLPVA